ncbi:MAG: PEP-CTERM sorting domain-containing protein, partial [Fibrella sp.]|nr:PEP-CTERM sorting domain-containing protein [Armatimonadota bacterium]
TLGTGDPFDNDTELGLYDAFGNLLASSDDAFATGFLSQIVTSSLVSGQTYYVSVSGFNTTYAGGFGVTSTSDLTGNYQLNITTTVPESGTVVLLSMGLCAIGGIVIRRRRSS